ncbi:MAG: hypothetical protein HYY43_04080 [Deltaproteobacteria bacterium]|nr:hypothetical protein [Deltaproteobacteria bacterium]
MKRYLIIIAVLFMGAACSKTSTSLGPNLNIGDISALRINDDSKLIGGPLAQAQIGDILLSNDKIRAIIQQPSKFVQSCPFGGVIIDADLNRGSDTAGQDNFGKMCPLVNVEWTINYHGFQVVSSGADGGPQVVRALGTIDVLDYLDLDFISPVAKALTGQTLYFSPRYDDANNPFATYEDLRNLNTEVATEYTLEPGLNYIKMVTTYENNGDDYAVFPIGRFVNGSGQVQTLIPGLGFTPQPTAQITGDTPAVIYVPFQGVDVSYGYFYDLKQFASEDTSAVKAQSVLVAGKTAEDGGSRQISTSLTYSGVTGILLGEEFLKALPLGGPSEMKVNFKVPPHGNRAVTEYFVVGNGNAGSVFDGGLKALNVPSHSISGKVVDAGGMPVAAATVVVQNENKMTIITYRTGSDGGFSGLLSTGEDSFAKAFGSGKYNIFVEKQGYHKEGTNVAGTCTPETVDVTVIDAGNISCVIGSSGTVMLAGGVTDADSGAKIPARLTIVGFDPSPDSHAGAAYATTHGAGNFEDTWIFERPWGIVDVKYVNSAGTFGLGEGTSFKLEPGRYAFVFSHGVEYEIDVREIEVPSGGTTQLDNIKLKRLIKTPGWISADFHLHSIASPDSAMSTERRALAAAGEGMDILQSSDHDWLVDYAPVVDELTAAGLIPNGSMATIVGDEISPNHSGHIHVFPLVFDPSKIDGGALDWSYSDHDTIDPSPDFMMSPADIINFYRHGEGANDGEKVLQINHIADQATSLPIISSWVTSTFFKGVPPLSSYVEPSAQRIVPSQATPSIPIPFGSSGLVVSDFTAVELTIGPELYTNLLRESGLPQWFNLLNLGILATATGDSDSHRETVDQLGMPRNYIASSVDPRDGIGSFSEINHDAYAHAINQHKLVVSAGPFISINAKGEDGSAGGVGDTITGKKVTLHIDVKSPSWAWFDTIEIFANTEPLPADDDGISAFEGVASDPKSFFAPYHIPKFYYEPQQVFTTGDDSLKDWKDENGLISASLDVPLNVDEDTWVVVFVSGNPGGEGWRSLFPLVTKSAADPTKIGAPPKDWTLETLAKDPNMKASAWGFANPIFIDTDGDTDGDGVRFESKYIRSGISPLAK